MDLEEEDEPEPELELELVVTGMFLSALDLFRKVGYLGP